MSRSNKTWSPSKENLLMQHLAKLERSTSSEDSKTFGSQCSINLDNKYLDLPTEPKRRRLMADDTPSSISSQVSSQVSSRSHSPSLSMSESSLFDDSAMSTPSASPSATLKDHFRKKYRKDELWAAIETNYKYLMDKGIIEACQTTESEGEETTLDSNVSFGEFLTQYKELSDWLKNIQITTQQKKASKLALAEKYLNQSYHEEIQRSPRRKAFNEYAWQLTQRQPILRDEINVFLKEVNTQWDALEAATAPTYLDPDSMLRDLQDDLVCLRKYLDGLEDDLRGQTMRAWAFEELEGVLKEHKALQQDIESHSRVVSAILKLSERLQNDNDAFDRESLEREHQRDSVELSALNLERRWHGIWLQSLEWQCRLEDAISRKAGVYNPGTFLDSSLRDYTESDTEYDLHDVTSSGDDSFQGLGYRSDFIQSPPKSDSSASFSPDCDTRSTGKDSAIVSETEIRTSSDMSEAYQDLSVSSTGSDSDREYLRMMKMRKRDSRDIGYGSESASDELDSRYNRPGITFSGINGRARNVPKSGNFYTTVIVDKIDTESTDKTDGGNNADQTTCDESDLGSQLQAVFMQEESEKEDIHYLIDQADIMVQQGNTFNKSLSGQGHSIGIGINSSMIEDGSPKSSSSSGAAPEMIDKGVGTIESSCDASGEESGESDEPGEEISMVTDDGADTFDSVVCSEYTSDEMRYASKDYTRLPKLYDTTSLKRRVKGRGKERPWSVIELADVMETKPLSTSESAIDKLAGTYSDSDIPSKSSALSQSASPTLSRHRIRRTPCMTRSKSESYSLRSQVGAKRKLDLELPLSNVPPIDVTTHSEITNLEEFENVYNTGNVAQVKSVTVNKYNVVSNDLAMTPEAATSGNATIVPSVDVFCTSDEETSSEMPLGNEMIYALQNARFRSSGSSYEDSDTQGDPGGVVSEPDDQNNGNASSYSESAWDNYQAPLYPSCGEGAQEEALHWEPGDLEFDDEFSLPQSTIIATLIARRSEEETYTGARPKLVPSHHGNYDDSDSDIEDLRHVLDESRMQLKVADKSLRKKRKDPLATGLYLNPGKYGELLATIDTNIKCLEAISQHLQPADVTEDDMQTIQDLLYQWEKLQALASERRNQSQELKTMYATMLSVQGNILDGVPELERTRFRNMEDLVATIASIQGTQKLLHNQQQMVKNLHVAIDMFSSHNPSVNVEGVIKQLQDTDGKLDCLQYDCVSRLRELGHIAEVWREYKGQRTDLEWLLKEERELLERLAFSQEVDMDVYKFNMETDLKKLMSSLAMYEEKLIQLQQLRAELVEVADEDVQLDLTAGIADIRNQLYVAQQQCRDIVFTDDLARSAQGHVEDMEIEEEVVAIETVPPKKLEEPKSTLVRKRRGAAKPKPKPKKSLVPDWLKSFPVQAIALAVFLGLMYFVTPESLRKLINFTLRLSPDLKYVHGAPPM